MAADMANLKLAKQLIYYENQYKGALVAGFSTDWIAVKKAESFNNKLMLLAFFSVVVWILLLLCEL